MSARWGKQIKNGLGFKGDTADAISRTKPLQHVHYRRNRAPQKKEQIMGRPLQIALVVTSTILVSSLWAAEPKAAPKAQPKQRLATPKATRPARPFRPSPRPNPNPGGRGPQHPGGDNIENGGKGHFNDQNLQNLYHISPKGPQRTAPQLKNLVLKDASKVQRHIHDSKQWHGWHHLHHAWVWGVYGILPANQGNVVVGVPSGNTLAVRNGAGIVRNVRLAGVGAPLPNQPSFSESRATLASLANGRHVRVFRVGQDFDGTIAAKVLLDSGEYVNEKQVSTGFAWNAVDDGFDATLAAAEQTAQAVGRGLWGGDYLPAFN
jgi:endonuclease YncB( thermonuclease family)